MKMKLILAANAIALCGAALAWESPSRFGVCSHLNRWEFPVVDQQLPIMKKAGIKYVRTDLDWAQVEPKEGEWNFSKWDAVLDEISAQNMEILPILPGAVPKRAAPAYKNLDKFETYLRKCVERYKDRIKAWEIYNEPNLKSFWGDNPNPAEYAKLLERAYKAIKSIDPELKVLYAGVSGVPIDYIEKTFEAGASKYFDIMNIHPYQHSNPEEILPEEIKALKELMKKYGIPTAGYETFDDPAKVMDYIRSKGKYPVVIKADGLALGKGVLICQNEQEAADGVKEIMLDKKFGASGNHVVVEEFLTGPEVSVLSFCDGKTVKPMVSSMDHKRALDHDEGLNTGGMGTVAPNPCYTPAIAAECMEKIFLPTVAAMQAEGCPFKGCLYFGLMLTPDGPKVIEYNCRFGDPETQVVLPLLESDLLTVMQACTNGTLDKTEVKFSDGAAACVVLASGGYPVAYEKGKEITGLENGQVPGAADVTVYHAGTAIKDGKLVTNGGRVLGVTATAATLPEALKKAYAAADCIHFDKLHRRSDIGARALAAMKAQEG